MPGKVKVKIIAGRNLPVMDRSSDTTDAYVEIKLANTTYKTDVCRKSLHPQWNSEWYRFEVDDSELQDEPLQIRLMDHDTYSANDAIGKVYLDLNPLLLPAASLLKCKENALNHEHKPNSVMSGWIPVYDTMHGIRGEVNVIVKVELFIDSNKFRQSSCGVQFFCSPAIPHGFYAQILHGFVEELVVNDDPEYQWIDKIRTPRASNEARQTLFFKLSGVLQRKIGVKALDLGGNAVIGYNQSFDLEGDSGIVARGIGTAVTLVKMIDIPTQSIADNIIEERAISYLKFLGCDKGFHLNKKPHIVNYNKLLPHIHPRHSSYTPRAPFEINELNPVVNHPSKKFTRHLSQLDFTKVPQPVMQHSTSLQTLLKQEDMRGTPGTGISQRIKNLKYSSQNILSKKMTALKAKLSDVGTPEEGEEPKALSATDLLDLKKKKSKFLRTNDSNTMAELLVRSIIQVHNSLDCIMEAHDPPPAFHKQISLTESSDNNERTDIKAESYLSLPDSAMDTHSSVTSEVSDSSSSDGDVSDAKENSVDYDTISEIVKNVRKLSLLNTDTSENSLQNIDVLDVQTEVDSNEEDDIEITDGNLTKSDEKSPDVTPDDLNIFKEPWQFDQSGEIVTNVRKLSLLDTDTSENSLQNVLDVRTNEGDEIEITDVDEKTPDVTPDDLNIFKEPWQFNKPGESEKKMFLLGDDDGTKSAPPIAESDNFSINSSNDEINTVSNIDENFDPEKHDRFIFPQVTMGANIEDNGLMKTALQTLLLERLNIIGSCTPPTSPVEPSKPTPSGENDSFFPKIAKTFESIRRSSSSKSLCPFELKTLKKSSSLRDISSKPGKSSRRSILSLQDHENVLGAPFMALKKSEDIKPEDTNDAKVTKATFLTKAEDKIRNVFQSPIAFLNNKNRESVKKRNEQKGLLGTALQNVLMESVNDILATSQGNVPEKLVAPEEQSDSIESKVEIEISPTSQNIVTNNNCVFDKNLTTPMPANTEIEKGINKANNLHASLHPSLRLPGSPLPEYARQEYGHQRTESMGAKMSHSPAKLNAIPCIHRRSSDSDLSITPKGNSLTGSDRSGGAIGGHFMRNNALMRSTVPQENFDIMEYPFLTMSKYPPGFVAYMGGAVSARSVKLLERITNIEEPESRDTWWSEIRMEIRSHARALNCNAVLGYCETTSICDDVCVLSANGTAAIIGFQYANSEVSDCVGGLPIIPKSQLMNRELMGTSLDRSEFEKDKKTTETPSANQNNRALPESPERDVTSSGHSHNPQSCAICHLPYSGGPISLRSTILKCHVCRTGKVPDVLIATIEMPEGIPSMGRGCFVESHVCRPLRDLKGESYAKEISDGLPFLEYELHRILVNKLKVKGMNAIFGLKVRVSIGEKMLIGMATGTAVFLSPLPPPPLPKLVSDRSTDERKLVDLQKKLHDTIKRNKEIYQLKPIDDHPNGRMLSDTDDSEDEQTVLDLALGNKDCCILEVDDPEDVEVLNLLMETRPPDGFHVVNTELVPGLEDLEIVKNLQMFIQIWRAKIQPSSNLDIHFKKLLETVYFKLRRMIPCALCDLQFRVDSPEPDEIQLCVLGMALGLGDPQKALKCKRKIVLSKRNEDELIFNLEEDQIPENSVVQTAPNTTLLHTQLSKHRQKSPQRKRFPQRHVPYRERHGVDITPLSYVPGGKIERYLGNLNFFFIRETTSIREEGGLSGFIHSFVTEVLAIVRAHVTALGGNAMVAYSLTECVLNHNLHKNQGQCLINVGGDVVYVSYFAEDQ